jgi:hypothetical protein
MYPPMTSSCSTLTRIFCHAPELARLSLAGRCRYYMQEPGKIDYVCIRREHCPRVRIERRNRDHTLHFMVTEEAAREAGLQPVKALPAAVKEKIESERPRE